MKRAIVASLLLLPIMVASACGNPELPQNKPKSSTSAQAPATSEAPAPAESSPEPAAPAQNSGRPPFGAIIIPPDIRDILRCAQSWEEHPPGTTWFRNGTVGHTQHCLDNYGKLKPPVLPEIPDVQVPPLEDIPEETPKQEPPADKTPPRIGDCIGSEINKIIYGPRKDDLTCFLLP